MAGMTAVGWLQLTERELLLFALFWFIVGMADELAIDGVWLWLRLSGQLPDHHLAIPPSPPVLRGPWAVFIPAWHEADVIGATVAHMLGAWPQPGCRLYVGCYRNDRATIAAVMAGAVAAGGDARLRLVIHDRDGPTTKADCLNRLFAAMAADEARANQRFRGVVMHDAVPHVARMLSYRVCASVKLRFRNLTSSKVALVTGIHTKQANAVFGI